METLILKRPRNSAKSPWPERSDYSLFRLDCNPTILVSRLPRKVGDQKEKFSFIFTSVSPVYCLEQSVSFSKFQLQFNQIASQIKRCESQSKSQVFVLKLKQ